MELNKRDLVAAHRAGDWERAKLLSQKRQMLKNNRSRWRKVDVRRCLDCGVAARGLRCIMHYQAFRRLAGLLTLWLATTPLAAFQSVTLAWDPNPEPDVRAYIVYYGTAPRTYTASTNVGNVTTATVYGLTEGLTYYFAITATNTTGLESNLSNEVTNAIPVAGTNMVPTIEPIADRVVTNAITIPVRIWDVDDHPTNLLVTASVVPPLATTAISGLDHNRLLTLVPVASGRARVMLVVTDPSGNANATSFNVDVVVPGAPPAQPVHFRIRTIYEWSAYPEGPWTTLFATELPFPFASNLWYRTWK